MKSPLTFALCLAGFSAALSVASLRADDWKTTDGKVYQDVKVIKTEPDAVTILHRDGGARVPLSNLSPALQNQFKYDPATAKAAVALRSQNDLENAKALEAEVIQAHEQQKAQLIAEDPRVQNGTLQVPEKTETAASSADASPLAAPSDPTHHSMSQLVDVTKRLYDDHPDDTHHSIAYLKLVAHDLGPDPSDPTHHTMDQLFSGDPLARP